LALGYKIVVNLKWFNDMRRLNRNFILAIILLSFPSPVNSLTWQELFDAVSPDKFNFPTNANNKQVTCWKKVYWEEYIEGDAYTSGYVKKYRKEIKINCPY
tara:strand:- start:135 stop:437 length:303 start_codon:yes stop_codon:yes gene_type:complete